ncbi:TIGR00180 family glycosyltransferase [Nisaea acidiphila]|uniref:TIGR00180 family glycosyltransferase n=1 Tax=Nisaea acidiphila TaxID=1862145 RepID=A0A9J7AR30_9PROT|nr:TIGR00180 family glycosyltransferase [Nisaea acidiphila]UUX50067.1 TIGR00180 family glycosyltransferase [Nisaea acidiphila]
MRYPALIIPTVESRSGLLRRALGHLAESGYSGRILVADHSRAQQSECRPVSLEFSRVLDIEHRRQDPEIHFLERINDAAECLADEYVMLHADDDFVIMPGLVKCVAHLENQPDSVLCQGRMARVEVRQQDGRTEIAPVGYSRRSRCESNPLMRLVLLLENYCATLYAVHRRTELMEAVEHTLRYSRDVTYWQYLLTCICVLKGKNPVIDELHYLREMHDTSWSASAVRTRDPEHVPWIFLSPEFSRLTEAFRTGITDFIKAEIGEPTEKFWPHFDQACLGLFRWALGCGTKDEDEPGEAEFLARLVSLDTAEHAALLKCGRRIMEGR